MSLNLPFNSCTVFFPLDFVSMLENLVIMATLKICKRHKQESITIHEFQWKNAQKEKSYRCAVINSFVSYLSFRILDYYVIPSFLFLGGGNRDPPARSFLLRCWPPTKPRTASFFSFVHENIYSNQLVGIFEIYNKGLAVSYCVFRRALPLIVFKKSFCYHHTVLVVDYVKFLFSKDGPILLYGELTTGSFGVI